MGTKNDVSARASREKNKQKASWHKLSALSSFLYRFPRKVILSSETDRAATFCGSLSNYLVYIQSRTTTSTRRKFTLDFVSDAAKTLDISKTKSNEKWFGMLPNPPPLLCLVVGLAAATAQKTDSSSDDSTAGKGNYLNQATAPPPTCTSHIIRGAGGKFIKSTRQLQRNALQCSDDKRRRGLVECKAKAGFVDSRKTNLCLRCELQ